MELAVDYGSEFVELDRVEETPKEGYSLTSTGGAPGGVLHASTRQGGVVVVPLPPPKPPEDAMGSPLSEGSSDPWRGTGCTGQASTPAVEDPLPPGGRPRALSTTVEEGKEGTPGHDVSLPDSEKEVDHPPTTAPSPGAPMGAIRKKVRLVASPYPWWEHKRTTHLGYKQLGGGAPTRRPSAAPGAGGSSPPPAPASG